MGIKHSRPVPPFMRYCSAIIPTMFDDSLSYYEALCALNRFIQTNIVEVINNNASVTQEYIQLVDELKDYVEHYFDNLDVQEEINNKLDAMVEDGTFAELLDNYVPKLKYVRVSDYATENDYADLQAIYAIAKAAKKGIYIDGTFKVNTTLTCDDYIEICGGKLIADSYLTDASITVPKNIIVLQNGGYIHDIEFESTADQIPYINKRVGQNYGYASNINAVSTTSSNVTIERITTDYMTGVWVLGSSGNHLDNVNIDKCKFNHAEMGIYCQLASLNLTNSVINMSEDVQSIYYHPIYAIIIDNCNFANLDISTNELVHQTVELTQYYINDVFHIYNPDDETYTYSKDINISNVNISGHFNLLTQATYNQNVFYTNIRGSFKNAIYVYRSNVNNIKINDSIFEVTPVSRVIDCLNEFNQTDNIEFNNCKITFTNNCTRVFGAVNLTFNNCCLQKTDSNGIYFVYDDSIADGYMIFNDCRFEVQTISRFCATNADITYNKCYFKNAYMSPTADTNVTATTKCKVIGCYFEALRNLWDTQYQNKDLIFDVIGWDTYTSKQKHITSIPA